MTHNELNTILAKQFGLNDAFIDRMNGEIDNDMINRLRVGLENVQGRLAKMYAEHGSGVTLAEMSKYDRLAKIENSILSELKSIGADTSNLTEAAIKSNFAEGYYGAGFAYESSLRSGLTFTQLPIDVIRAAVINPYDRIGWKTRSKKNLALLDQWIKETITDGLIQGYGYKKTAQVFGKKFSGYTNNLKRIITTETHRAATMGSNLAYDRAKKGADNLGIKLEHVWDATLDGKTRFDHAAIDGAAADENGEWHFPSGQVTKGPSLSGSAKQDIHCRCSVRGEVDGNTPQTRIDNITKEKIKHTSYDEWAKDKDVPYNKMRDKLKGNLKADAKPPTFTPAKTVKEAEKKIRYDRKETAIVFDKDGNEIFRKSSNSKKEVVFTDNETLKFKDNILTHNHPSLIYPLSIPDIETAADFDMFAIRAIADRKVYQMARGADGWAKDIDALKLDIKFKDKSLFRKYKKMVSAGELTPGIAQVRSLNELWEYVANEYNLKYTIEDL